MLKYLSQCFWAESRCLHRHTKCRSWSCFRSWTCDTRCEFARLIREWAPKWVLEAAVCPWERRTRCHHAICWSWWAARRRPSCQSPSERTPSNRVGPTWWAVHTFARASARCTLKKKGLYLYYYLLNFLLSNKRIRYCIRMSTKLALVWPYFDFFSIFLKVFKITLFF